MSHVGLVIDNSATLSEQEKLELKVDALVPISFVVNGEEYYEDVNMSYADFYNFLQDKEVNLSTSQPSIEKVKETWREVLAKCDELVYIILSSGLSEACNVAQNASHEAEFEGRVFVVNNQRVSYMNKMSIYQASKLIEQGKSASEIKAYLEQTKAECGAYIAVDTIKYLKKGGRITPAAAMVSSLLNIKPILQVHGGKLDACAKVMSMRQAKSKIIQATRKEAEERFPEEIKQGKVYVSIAHTFTDKESSELYDFKKEVESEFPDMKFFVMDPLPLFVACHTGPKALAVGYVVDRLNVLEK